MLSWLRKLTDRPDHPMYNMAEARKLLQELPQDDTYKSLEEVSSWLQSVTDTANFNTELRIDLIKLLDETGQPSYAKLLKEYLSAPHLQDFQGMHLWKNMHAFTNLLARAYSACLVDSRKPGVKSFDLMETLPLLSLRLIRAAAENMKLELMRYIDVSSSTWEDIYRCYSEAESGSYARHMIFAYPGYAVHTSVQHEFLRALVLHQSSPGNLAPDQIEVASRIAARMVSFFDLTAIADVSSEYFLDLSLPAPPRALHEAVSHTPTMRYFSPLRAVPRLAEIIKQHDQGTMVEERRFGSEFTPQGKLTVLKHLLVHWNKYHPQRLLERRNITAEIEVAHGFRTLCKLIPRIEIEESQGMVRSAATSPGSRARLAVLAEGEFRFTSEQWSIVDVSLSGIGATIPKSAGAWVKIGDLCAVKVQNVPSWWICAIRRLHADHPDLMHVGLEIMGKKPLAVWLRVLGSGVERVSNWETSSGSFKYDYYPAILLPDEHNSFMKATMLLETGSYAPNKIYEIMLGEKSKELELINLRAEGEDYEWVEFRWMVASYDKQAAS